MTCRNLFSAATPHFFAFVSKVILFARNFECSRDFVGVVFFKSPYIRGDMCANFREIEGGPLIYFLIIVKIMQ